MKKIIAVSALAIALAGCQSTGPNQAIGTGVGAVGGYAIGRSLGGGPAGSALGAVAGAVIGSEVGRSMDQQPQGYPTYPVYPAYPRYRERPVYVERPRYHHPRCEIIRQYDHRFGGYRDIRVCNR